MFQFKLAIGKSDNSCITLDIKDQVFNNLSYYLVSYKKVLSNFYVRMYVVHFSYIAGIFSLAGFIHFINLFIHLLIGWKLGKLISKDFELRKPNIGYLPLSAIFIYAEYCAIGFDLCSSIFRLSVPFQKSFPLIVCWVKWIHAALVNQIMTCFAERYNTKAEFNGSNPPQRPWKAADFFVLLCTCMYTYCSLSPFRF